MTKLVLLFNIILLFYSCQPKKSDRDKTSDLPTTLFSDGNDSLMSIIINIPPVEYCNQKHYHFVDIVAKYKIDSLINSAVDTILYYRDWIGTNGLNGYGKLMWV